MDATSDLLAGIANGTVTGADIESHMRGFGGGFAPLAFLTAAITSAMKTADVAPSDDTDLPHISNKGLTVNEDGNLSLIFAGDDDQSAPVVRAVVAGVHYPWCVKKILATDTTATGIAIYW